MQYANGISACRYAMSSMYTINSHHLPCILQGVFMYDIFLLRIIIDLVYLLCLCLYLFLAIFGRSNAFFCSFLLIIVVVLKNVAVLTTMYHQFAEDWVPTAGFLSLKKNLEICAKTRWVFCAQLGSLDSCSPLFGDWMYLELWYQFGCVCWLFV